ncbi:putative signal peptide protein [Puccinia sorghi]|uniref:Putative signal peptide protein n=1 Tax=Puccinia sorghi TaxID=27349 RepID=A0A0L6VV56_9BASI|nr:putative signal peptide protein [Puccinia sorghi]
MIMLMMMLRLPVVVLPPCFLLRLLFVLSGQVIHSVCRYTSSFYETTRQREEIHWLGCWHLTMYVWIHTAPPVSKALDQRACWRVFFILFYFTRDVCLLCRWSSGACGPAGCTLGTTPYVNHTMYWRIHDGWMDGWWYFPGVHSSQWHPTSNGHLLSSLLISISRNTSPVSPNDQAAFDAPQNPFCPVPLVINNNKVISPQGSLPRFLHLLHSAFFRWAFEDPLHHHPPLPSSHHSCTTRACHINLFIYFYGLAFIPVIPLTLKTPSISCSTLSYSRTDRQITLFIYIYLIILTLFSLTQELNKVTDTTLTHKQADYVLIQNETVSINLLKPRQINK